MIYYDLGGITSLTTSCLVSWSQVDWTLVFDTRIVLVYDKTATAKARTFDPIL